MNELALLNEQEVLGKQFRVFGTSEEPLFLAKDVAEWIEHSNPTEMVRGVDNDEKLNSTIFSAGQNREVTLLTEDGLYEVLMQSRKPIAKQFKKKVKEILKTIRKTGAYQVPQTTAGQIQLLAQGHMELLNKIETVEKNLQTFKEEMPLLALDCQRITNSKNRKVVDLLGGKSSPAYRNASLRGKVYRDLEKQLNREFDVTSYKAIQRNQTDKAIEIIKAYTLPYYLQENVNDVNAQMNLAEYTEAS